MAEDDDISRRYRNLPPEEPPRHVDDAIRAAARRGVRPGRRWYFPVAAAAIIVLAIAVTMHVEREQPSEEIASAPPAPASAPSTGDFSLRDESRADKPRKEKLAPQPELRRKAETPQPASPAPEPRPAQEATAIQENAAAARSERREAPQAVPRSAQITPQAGGLSADVQQSPERWLQGIADLRRQGRHDEADKALAEFRKRYPDYRISKEVLEQIEKR